eukprot:UN18612
MKRKWNVNGEDEVREIWIAARYAHNRQSQVTALQNLRRKLLDEFELNEQLLEKRGEVLSLMEKVCNKSLKNYTSYIGPILRRKFIRFSLSTRSGLSTAR